MGAPAPSLSKFPRRLRAGETLLGAFVNLGSPLATEIMGSSGLDWLVIDLEHGAGSEGALLGQLHALKGTEVATLVRVEGIDLPRFMHALDLGANGVLVPRIRSVADAKLCVDYCRYGGQRGVARYNRAWQWGRVDRTLGDVDAEIVCAVQIETREALERVDEIASVDGLDVLFVGPADLAHAFGLECPPDAPELVAIAAEVAQVALAHGKTAGVFVGTVHQLRLYHAAGFRFLGCSSDGGLLSAAAFQLSAELSELRKFPPPNERP
jgi:4-hydroxy-2-oxoheptanedioate aldolase